ncbi:hypothetical protein GCM10022393_05520 [Aquimarina addita]|uniref:Lasso RiPP family leader peptide-containing protein n=1 Tax=Aquimarina addita TaxID=870485 RepID=A0ABP7XBI0_9FLAO
MKKTSGKKLTIDKFKISKLDQPSAIRGGAQKTDQPDDGIFYYLLTRTTINHTGGNTNFGN